MSEGLIRHRPRISWGKGLAAQLGRATILVVALALAVVGPALIFIAHEAQRRSVDRLLEKNGESVALLVSGFLGNATSSLAFLEVVAAQEPAGSEKLQESLESGLLYDRSPFTSLTLLDGKGREVCKVSRFHTYLPGELKDVSSSEAFRAVRSRGHWLSPVHVSSESGLLSLVIARPFRSPSLEGVLVGEVNVSRLWHEVSDIHIGQRGYAYLVDARGRFLAYQKPSEILNRYGEDMRRMPPVEEFASGAGSGQVREYVGLSQEKVIGRLTPISGTDWAVVMELPADEALAPIRKMEFSLAALAILGVVGAGGVGVLLSARLLRPIGALTEAALRMGDGDLNVPLGDVDRPDEVGSLARTFQHMQTELSRLYRSLECQVMELTQAQQDLRSSESRYRALFENSGVAMAILEESLSIRMVNQEFAALTGRSREEIEGHMNWMDLVARPSDRERMARYHLQRRESGPHPPSTYEFEAFGKDGAIRHLVVNVVLLPGTRDSLASFLDFTGLRKAELARRESERKFRAIFEEAFQLVGILAPDGTILESNRSAERFFGKPRGAFIGLPFWDLPVWGNSDEMRGNIRHAVETAAEGGFVRLEVNPLDGAGEPHSLDLSVKPVWNEASEVGLLIVEGRDITELKRHEEERSELQEQLRHAQKMESIGRLAGGVAHDFNNMLTAIYGNLDLVLMDTPPDDPRHQRLLEVQQAADSAARLTAQLLAFSRKQLIEPRVLDLNEFLSTLVKMLSRLIGENIRLEYAPGRIPCLVRVDPGQFEQVVFNLAVNARDAMPEGGALTVSLERVHLLEGEGLPRGLEPGEHVLLTVRDSGVGMTPEVLSRVFEPFFTTKELGRGTGLGLAMVYGAMRQNAGAIEVDSEPGRGTAFRLYFPAVTEGRGEELPAGEREDLPGGTETILFVEDNPYILESSGRILEMLGYRVLRASSAEEALAAAAGYSGEIHLLMADVVLPAMNGQELAAALCPGRPGMRVLFSSGYTDNPIVNAGVLEQSLQFLSKPYSAQSLSRTIRQVLDR